MVKGKLTAVAGPRALLGLASGTLTLAFVIWVYRDTLTLGYFYDDPGNLFWAQSKSFVSLFTSAQGFHYFRPMGFLLWKVTVGLMGTRDPAIYHLLNLSTHLANVILICILTLMLTRRRLVTFLSGIFLAVHPYNFDLAYISTLWYPLSTLFVAATVFLYVRGRDSATVYPWTILASYLTMLLALLTHESGVVAMALIVAYDLISFRSPRITRRTLLRYIPCGVLTVVYLLWWRMVPKDALVLAPHHISDVLLGAKLFLEGMIFPMLWSLTWLSQVSGMAAEILVYPLSLLLILAGLFVAKGTRAAVVFFLCWWALGALPALVNLPAGYILGSPRLFYMSSVGVAVTWALVVDGLADLAAGNRKALLAKGRQYLTAALLTLVVLAQAVPFIEERVTAYRRGSDVINVATAQAKNLKPGSTLIYLNLPAFVPLGPRRPPVDFLPLHPDMESLLNVLGLGDRKAGVYYSWDFSRAEAGDPKKVLQWSHFVKGQPIGIYELAKRSVLADKACLFDFESWRLLDIDRDRIPDEEPSSALSLVRYARRLVLEGTAAYLSWPFEPGISLPKGAVQHPRVKTYDGRKVLVLPGGQDSGALYLVDTSSDQSSLSGLRRAYPNEVQVLGGKGPAANLAVIEVRNKYPPSAAPSHPLRARLGSLAQLIGFDLDERALKPGETIHFTIYWQAVSPADVDYTVFTHLTGPGKGPTGTKIWAQADGQPGGGSYPTSAWDAGEIILDRYEIPIAKDTPPGTYQIEVGMYLLKTMQRLPVTGPSGEQPGDRVVLGTISVIQ